MPFRRGIRHSVYSGLPLEKAPRSRRRAWLIAGAVLLAAVVAFSLYLRSLTREMVISDARDAVTLAVAGCVNRIVEENGYGYEDFVTLQKDAGGDLTAITADTMRINAFSSQLLSEITRSADNEALRLRIPLGILFGSDLLMGRGPEIPIDILMLTSSLVRFDNELVSTGINQSRHAITLRADVDIDVLLPWETIHSTVETDVLVAETVIVGRVPQTYVNITEDQHGRK